MKIIVLREESAFNLYAVLLIDKCIKQKHGAVVVAPQEIQNLKAILICPSSFSSRLTNRLHWCTNATIKYTKRDAKLMPTCQYDVH
jgi:hypothetical protein